MANASILDAPTNLEGGVGFGVGQYLNRPVVYLSWTNTASFPKSYRVEAGSAAGLSDMAVLDVPLTFGGGLPGQRTEAEIPVSGGGTFYVRVREVTTAGISAPSNEIVIRIGVPLSPRWPIFGPAWTVTGSTVVLQWVPPPPTLFNPSSYVIEVSSRPAGVADLANFTTGTNLTTLLARDVPAGTYYVRVRSATPYFVSPPSNEIVGYVLGSSCTVPPSEPESLRAFVQGATVSLIWYSRFDVNASSVIEAGSRAGLADLAVVDTGSSSDRAQEATFNDVGRGTYFVRVRGKNGCGVSSPSNEISVVVS